MKFSERYGHVPVRSALQTGAIDGGLRNRLWNLVLATFFHTAPAFRGAPGDFLPSKGDAHQFFKDVWNNYLKQTVDGIGNSYFDAVKNLKGYFTGCLWYEVYDFIEFLADGPYTKNFVDSVNAILKEEASGYRFVSGRLVQITSEEEIAAI